MLVPASAPVPRPRVRLAAPDPATTTTRCDVPRIDDPLLPCYRPATHRVRSICVHEHVTVDDVCDACLAELRAGRTVCAACEDSPDSSHACRRHLSSADPL